MERDTGLVARLRRRVERAVESEGDRAVRLLESGCVLRYDRGDEPDLQVAPSADERRFRARVERADAEPEPVIAPTDPWEVREYTANADAELTTVPWTASVFEGERPDRFGSLER